MTEYQITETAQKPPLGLRPRFIVAEHRVREIDEAIQRFTEAGWVVPAAWTEERADLVTWLNRNTRHPVYPPCPRRQCRGRVPHSWLVHLFGWIRR